MRIIKFIFKSVLVVLVLVGLSALVAREVLLMLGANKIESSLTELRRIAASGGHYEKCRRAGAVPLQGQTNLTLQLRFISDGEYLTEVVCGQSSFKPITLSQAQLPPLVYKVAGQSGIVWGNNLSGVKLEVFGRQVTVGVEEGKIGRLSNEGQLGLSPKSTCQGYGYSCCQTTSEVGQGEYLSTVSDCPKTCYEQCQPRPVVLSLRTEPVATGPKQPVRVQAGEEVVFNYTLDVPTQEVVVELEYGDGKSEEFSQASKQAKHQYQCAREVCYYQAKLTAETPAGIKSADLPVNNIVIMVK